MKRNYMTGRRGKKRPTIDGLERLWRCQDRLKAARRDVKVSHRKLRRHVERALGIVHIGVTPWIEELRRIEAETGENPLKGARNIEFHLASGEVIHAGERRSGEDRRR